MRAMILAAGLGTRLRPFTEWLPKPALPVRGRPVISTLLEWLAAHGFDDVLVNAHHLEHELRAAVEADRPSKTRIRWSHEPAPLGTGGGIRRARSFLEEAETCVVLAGDMLIDLDLEAILAAHQRSGRRATLVLRTDSRSAAFGTIGVDREGRVRRISDRFDLGGETAAGVFTGVRIFSRAVFAGLPERASFEDLSDWLAPELEAGATDLGTVCVAAEECVWEPVGTPAEYLAVNLDPPPLAYLDWSSGPVRIEGEGRDVVIGRGARIGEDVRLTRAVVWSDEVVPAGFVGRDGVFAHGAFHPCGTVEATDSRRAATPPDCRRAP